MLFVRYHRWIRLLNQQLITVKNHQAVLLSSSIQDFFSKNQHFNLNQLKPRLLEEWSTSAASYNSSFKSQAEIHLQGLRDIVTTLSHLKTRPHWNLETNLFKLALYAKYQQRMLKKVNTTISSNDSTNATNPIWLDRDKEQDIARYCRLSHAIYAPTSDEFCARADLSLDQILVWNESSWSRPQHVLLVDPRREEIVLVIRGTDNLYDFCMNLSLVHTPFLSSSNAHANPTYGHQGMVTGALELQSSLTGVLKECLEDKYPTFRLVCTGHSLGAGVATVFTMLCLGESSNALALFQTTPTTRRISCVAFAPPACVSLDLAQRYDHDVITSIIHEHDVIPRLSESNLMALQTRVAHFDWREEFMSTRHWTELVMSYVDSIQASELGSFVHERRLWLGLGDLESDHRRLSIGRHWIKDLNPRKVKELVIQHILETSTAGLEKHQEQPQPEDNNHDDTTTRTLYPPGRILSLAKNDRGVLQVQEKSPQEYEEIILSENMMKDHLCSSYEASWKAFMNAHALASRDS